MAYGAFVNYPEYEDLEGEKEERVIKERLEKVEKVIMDGWRKELIIAKGVSNEPTDTNQLLPIVAQMKDNLGLKEIKSP